MATNRGAAVAGFNVSDWRPDPDYTQPIGSFRDKELFRRHRQRVTKSDNDFITVIAAASKSAVSGVGKTTLAIELARWFDLSAGRRGEGFDATQKATLDAGEFAQDMLADPETVPDKSAIIFDEGQGTLSSQGADARRSMAQSVMDVTTALSTMRFRQLSPIIVTQSTQWIDKRIEQVLDALVLIQPSTGGTIRAEVFHTYHNDLSRTSQKYHENIDTLTWEPLPKRDPDYAHLHKLKQQSATKQLEAEDDDGSALDKEEQKELAQHLRDAGQTIKQISESPFIEYSTWWVSENTEAPEDD